MSLREPHRVHNGAIGCNEAEHHDRCWMLGGGHITVLICKVSKAHNLVILSVKNRINSESFFIRKNDDLTQGVLDAVQELLGMLQTDLLLA